ncbi:MAG: 6-phosphofructokinase [Bdellovibrionaceae bacterium]|nr:6-phosphofructokinase [Pseudobdellovibrionaceae bacterium]MDW8190017.1 6-phosphofructokinase [Pseudobdellovibrionaceae bacterium]
MKRIGVFTSGGDAPGMNAAIRAVTRTAIQNQLEVIGFIGGYSGILQNQFRLLQARDMANILQRGGTILKAGRCAEFFRPEGRALAARNLKEAGIDGLICIGGDGSFTGARALFLEHQIAVVGIPGTIDNDVAGTDFTVGFDTAVNTALHLIDKIRDTADSHDRLFLVEVMGRNSGFIAAYVGLAAGAEEVLVSDFPVPVDSVIKRIQEAIQRGKRSSIIVVAEGEKSGRVYDLAEQFRKRAGLEAKVAILGHVQRGGSPTAADRILASRMGAMAVDALIKGHRDVMVGVQAGQFVLVPLELAIQKNQKQTPQEFLKLVHYLAI